MNRTLVSKPFNADDPTPIDVIVETYDDGTTVEYPKPPPRLVLNVDKSQILADGVDEATLTVSFEDCSLTDPVTATDEEGNVTVVTPAELVWSKVAPTGDVKFTINLRPTTVLLDAKGDAVLSLSTTVAGTYRVVASFLGYADVTTRVEALV